jgi:polyhydroxybutyrate depolymerase
MSGGMPSAGCAKNAGRPQGGVVMQSDRIYDFPAQYDGKTPVPLLLGLHAAGNPNTQLQSLTQGSPLETNFVRVFPKSAGSAWVYDTDISKLKAVIDDVLGNYCVDTSRMFATGHSSGAQMVVQMLCKGETRFKAVAPVAASKYCTKFSPVPVLYIQGMMDAQRGGGNGMDVVTMFATSNGCGSSTTPKSDVASCTSTFDHQPVTPGCVTYQGCMVPTLWCSHNDNGYNNTDGRQHGWPCFASRAIADFFMSM